MSYAVRMRAALDTTLPVRWRHSSLRAAVTDYCPLGYTATWGYVTAEARPDGDFRYDAEAITRAGMILQTSRAIWLSEMREFAARRRVEKRAGQRQPRRADRALFRPRWPGGPTRLGLVAAVSAVHHDSRYQEELNNCAATYIGRLGYLTEVERQDLVEMLDSVQESRFAGLLRYAVVDGGGNA